MFVSTGQANSEVVCLVVVVLVVLAMLKPQSHCCWWYSSGGGCVSCDRCRHSSRPFKSSSRRALGFLRFPSRCARAIAIVLPSFFKPRYSSTYLLTASGP